MNETAEMAGGEFSNCGISVQETAERLIAAISVHRHITVAFSGGVDSSVVLAAAARANLESLLAVTADSPSVPQWQLDTAARIAEEIGVEHQLVATSETTRPEYIANDSRRCFYCKQTLYAALKRISDLSLDRDEGSKTVLFSGTNADDLGDYRPGIQAGREVDVVTPLADLGLSKAEVRALARHFGLSNSELAASPCLASRIAYGVEVTATRLKRIEEAESYLRDLGLADLRVRLHENELARIEVPPESFRVVFQPDLRAKIDDRLRQLGFLYVTVDLGGLRSGSMNLSLVSITGAKG